MPMQPIVPEGSAPPLAPYSPGAKAGHWVYTSGVLALDKDGKTVGAGDVAQQTRHILESIRGIVEAGGGSLADVVFNQIILKDIVDYAAMNKVYGEFFPKNPPARFCIAAGLVKPEFLVEIASVACLKA
jgi:aminoacrylate peracid reductase